MRRRRLTVWLLVLLVVAHGARTADPHVTDTSSTTTTEPTTTESLVGRGDKKFGDRCEDTMECGFRGSVCDPLKHSCQCRPELPVTNHIDKCGVEVDINGSCFFTEQCENKIPQTECKDGRCTCRFEMTPIIRENKVECLATYVPPEPEQYVDPTMIGILVAMAAMFVIICVVLRLFSKARWRENRTIFNTPNPRLMNVSLLRDNKHPGGERRGSRGSNRAPSRQPSMASLRPQSPSASQGSRASLRGSRSSANSQSSRSPTKAPPPMTNNVHSNPNPDPNVTVEMQEPTA